MTGEAFWRTETGYRRAPAVAPDHIWVTKTIGGQKVVLCTLHGACPNAGFPDQGMGFSAPASDFWDIRSVEFQAAESAWPSDPGYAHRPTRGTSFFNHPATGACAWSNDPSVYRFGFRGGA